MAKPSISPDTEIDEQRSLVPLYRVVLLDDNDHTYDYVIEMLQKIFIFSLEQAYHHAEEVDRLGRTALITCELPEVMKEVDHSRARVLPVLAENIIHEPSLFDEMAAFVMPEEASTHIREA